MSATVWSELEVEQAFTRRVSVAKARVALTINAIVDAG
jgi:hypothetical protein